MYSHQYFTYQFFHVGCRWLWAKVSPIFQDFCDSPAQIVMHVQYVLLLRIAR
jgi:hypothetical protein